VHVETCHLTMLHTLHRENVVGKSNLGFRNPNEYKFGLDK